MPEFTEAERKTLITSVEWMLGRGPKAADRPLLIAILAKLKAESAGPTPPNTSGPPMKR
jgi:hypothetical protein